MCGNGCKITALLGQLQSQICTMEKNLEIREKRKKRKLKKAMWERKFARWGKVRKLKKAMWERKF